MQLKPNTLLQGGKYRIVRVLGQGGFGITYEAEQVSLHRKVAVKEFFMKEYCQRDSTTSHVTLGTTDGSKELVDRFRTKFIREAQMIAGLDHPNIVKIHDVFEENGTAYYVMEFMEGGSLSERVREEGPLPEKEAIGFVRQVGDALSYLHDRNYLHFDVKPANIMLNKSGKVVLIDFGISKHYDVHGSQTSSTPVGISKGYAPLEQYQQNEIGTFTPATDIYSLGATLYTLVTGMIPPSASEVNEDGLTRPQGISDSLWKAIKTAMQPRRKDRPQTVAAFLSMLGQASKETEKRQKESDQDKTSVRITKKVEPRGKKPEGQVRKTNSRILFAGISVILLSALCIFGLKWLPSSGGKSSKQTSPNQTIGTVNNHVFVDLGLSVKWATCNIGASSSSDSGSYFAWGEISPKSDYSWKTLRYCSDKKGNHFTKYNFRSANGSVDNEFCLDFSDDAARTFWGGTWRMPTDDEFKELKANCTITWMAKDGKNGYQVKSKVNGNSIFLPASGKRDGASLIDDGSVGYYWSSVLSMANPCLGRCLFFNTSAFTRGGESRYFGFPIRPVTQ